MLKFFVVAGLLLSFSASAADAPAKTASAEELAKSSWLRNETIEIYKKAMDSDGKFAADYGGGMVGLMKTYQNLRLDYFETVAREENFFVYLIARDDKPNTDQLTTIEFPNSDIKEKPKFWMYIEGSSVGKRRRDALLKYLEKTPEQNLKNLKEAGFLTLVKNAK